MLDDFTKDQLIEVIVTFHSQFYFLHIFYLLNQTRNSFSENVSYLEALCSNKAFGEFDETKGRKDSAFVQSKRKTSGNCATFQPQTPPQ